MTENTTEISNDADMEILNQPIHSDWHCELFGCGQAITLNPEKGKEPNWFHRKMQELCFGNYWYKIIDITPKPIVNVQEQNNASSKTD